MDSHADTVGFGGQFGYYTDVETGLDLLTQRYYDTTAGRFVTRDPIGYKGGVNLYGFTGNNPVNDIDPSGLDPQTDDGSNILPVSAGGSMRSGHSGMHRGTGQSNAARAMTRGLLDTIKWAILGVATDRLSLLGRGGEEAAEGAQAARGAKRGPRLWPNGAHNLTIRHRIGELEKQGMTHEAGGSRTEESIVTGGGFKSRRRVDITMARPDGSLYREQVERTMRDGSPVSREKKALDDIEKATGHRPGFTPYDR